MTKISQKDNPCLRQKATPIKPTAIGRPALNKIIKEMREALAGEADGVALAAPQIGVSLRLFIVSGKIFPQTGGQSGEDLVFINPVITKLSKKKSEVDEGCLSIRFIYGRLRRAEKATIAAWDETGRKFTWNGSGLLAQIFQHETDHLDGILFTDRAKDLKEINPDDLPTKENGPLI
ncbi:MAG: peptide deformylase [Candidatus Paceibacterota bacterium]